MKKIRIKVKKTRAEVKKKNGSEKKTDFELKIKYRKNMYGKILD